MYKGDKPTRLLRVDLLSLKLWDNFRNHYHPFDEERCIQSLVISSLILQLISFFKYCGRFNTMLCKQKRLGKSGQNVRAVFVSSQSF